MEHRTTEQIEAGLDHVRAAPRDAGTVELIVRRPDVNAREVVESAELDPDVGLVGDNWALRASSSTPDGKPHPEKQLTVMSARAIELIAGERENWPLAGDQLYVDFDLSEANAPAGTRLAIGTALIELTPAPHLGCAKFRERFGADALRAVNAKSTRALMLRGRNAIVVTRGEIRIGDEVRRG